MNKVVVIGGGAAGLLAGIAAAQQGAQTVIIEKMPALGKKMLITGKGRCNITNNCSVPEIIKNLPGNGKFLYSALNQFSNVDIVSLLEENGLKTKVERGNRVFPVSDRAADVVKKLTDIFCSLGGSVKTKTTADVLHVSDGSICAVGYNDGSKETCTSVVLATGGASYPATGSSGDGYIMAKELGHTIVPLQPSLVPLEIEEESDFLRELQGLALRNVTASIVKGDKVLGKEFGEMLFTHFGVSGPIILSLSRIVAQESNSNNTEALDLFIDLKPALSNEKLDARVQRDFAQYSRKQLDNGMKDLLPAALIPAVIDCALLSPEMKLNQLTKAERLRLVNALKNFSLPIKGTRPLAEAIVTAGGIATKEINSKTMESKLIKHLFFAGEVIDVDGYTGGFNLQAAFSSGFVAGTNAARNN